MLNKLKFNNLVISNKKGIQQSRVQTINKLVHKIRKLKALLEKHPDNSKCKQRIRKSTETMEILKKLNRADVMKQVLLMDKPAPTVITNGIATPGEVAVALLSMNKVMQGLIKRFRSELQLNEAKNDDWKRDLMESSKRKLKIQRTEEKRRKRLELKQQKSLGRKRQEWLEENQQHIGEKISFESDFNGSTTGVWKEEELSNDNIKETSEENNKSLKESERYVKECPIIEESVRSCEAKASNIKMPKEFEEKTLSVIKGNRNIFETQHSESSNDTGESLVVDPFFITDNGENYLSTAVIKRDICEEINNEEKEDLHMVKLNSYKEIDKFKSHRNQILDKNLKDSAQKRHLNLYKSKSQGEQASKWKSKHNNDRVPQMSEKNKKVAENYEKDLHPSWAAKQKFKPIIAEFKGKKITFEDNHLNRSSRHSEREVQTNSSTAQTNYDKCDSLHPSWVAKQKMKPSITTFQGKKITFDEND